MQLVLIPVLDGRAKQSCLEGQSVVGGTEFIPCKQINRYAVPDNTFL